MIQKCFSVFDSKTQAYLPPFFLQTAPQALRAIGDCANNTTHEFGRHPEDYTLFELGLWDDQNSNFDLHTTPIPLAKCIEMITQQELKV